MQRISITNPQNVIDGTAKKYYFKLRNTGGPKGDKGDKGDTGATGPQGPQGNAATVSVGSTTTLPVGYDATVTNSGSIYNAVLNFGIPQGPQGPQGAKGDKGDTGAQGETGPRGPQGERGTNATVYVGTTTTTNPGTQARVYNSGTDSNAVLNFEIPRGDVGPQPELVQTTGTSTTKAMSQNATTVALATKQNTIDSSHKLSADLVDDTSTTNKFVTASDKTTWNAKQNALTAGQGIDITSDVISTPAIVPEVVAELPATGAEGKLYLTPKNYTRSTATGNPITATVAEGAGAIESFQLDGDTEQTTYTGKNMIGFTEMSGTLNGVDYSIENDGTITLNGTSTSSGTSQLPSVSGKTNLKEGDITLTLVPISGSFTAGWLGYRTQPPLPDGTQVLYQQARFDGGYQQGTLNISAQQASDSLRHNVYFSPGASFNNFRCKLQVTAGTSHDTSYEPYVGGQPSPNPEYPQPIQTVTGEQTVTVVGKNLFDKGSQISNGYTYSATGTKDSLSTSSVQESYIPVLPSTTYTLHTDANSSQTTNFRVFICEYDSDKGFIQRDVPANTLSSTNTITTTANTYFVRLCFSTIGIDTLQFEKSASPTTYAPYSKQICPINLGKNLISASWESGRYNNSTGVKEPYSDNVRTDSPISVQPNTTYICSRNGSGVAMNILEYKADGSFIRATTISSGNSFTTGADTYSITMYRGISGGTEGIQLELGSNITPYAPYFTPIELCKLGDYQDYIWKDGEDWKVHKATGKVTLTGREDWTRATTGTTGVYRFWTAVTDIQQEIDAVGYANSLIKASGDTWSVDGISGSNSNRRIYIRYDSIIGTMPVEQLQTWLSTNNITAYYILATPTDTTITDQTLIAQLEAIRTASLETGANTITNSAAGSNLAGDMEISYYGYNPTNRYDKWLWLDLNRSYEQLNSPDTSSTLSTRSLGTTTEQTTVTRTIETESIGEKTELQTILGDKTEETKTTEPEESDGADER